jgi:hypothetical protein
MIINGALKVEDPDLDRIYIVYNWRDQSRRVRDRTLSCSRPDTSISSRPTERLDVSAHHDLDDDFATLHNSENASGSTSPERKKPRTVVGHTRINDLAFHKYDDHDDEGPQAQGGALGKPGSLPVSQHDHQPSTDQRRQLR